jgi:hypothetical protein
MVASMPASSSSGPRRSVGFSISPCARWPTTSAAATFVPPTSTPTMIPAAGSATGCIIAVCVVARQ